MKPATDPTLVGITKTGAPRGSPQSPPAQGDQQGATERQPQPETVHRQAGGEPTPKTGERTHPARADGHQGPHTSEPRATPANWNKACPRLGAPATHPHAPPRNGGGSSGGLTSMYLRSALWFLESGCDSAHEQKLLFKMLTPPELGRATGPLQLCLDADRPQTRNTLAQQHGLSLAVYTRKLTGCQCHTHRGREWSRDSASDALSLIYWQILHALFCNFSNGLCLWSV
ncbi:uncharacterized protein LOC129194296 [Dunckerocampus dactyliophorus]|uniref:uncharacterized protein LOC129194296 n=1 Tax=Dunckerocampus dactyliophorus TaxID=161453 RepID=UPI002404CDEE|nr:uncharacterized protein LOC129194296 [Dunckerocampus dactyliophorus]